MRTLLASLSFTALATAQITLHTDAGKALVAADAKVERIVEGRAFTEGTLWLPKTQQLLFTDIPKNQWLVWTAKDGCKEWKASEGANGNTLDLDGNVISCQHGAHNLVRHEADGKVTVLVSEHEGKPLNSPNDCAVRNDGTTWFTDPAYGLGKRKAEQPGRFVYRFDPATTVTTVVQKDFDQPNGLCFSPDHQRLYVADSGAKKRIGAFPVQADGTLGAASFWLDGGADGIRCDAQGNLYTTANDGVRIYSKAGEKLATIALPEQPSNCAFGGEAFTTLFVSARTSVYSVPLLVAGAAVPPARAALPAKASGDKL